VSNRLLSPEDAASLLRTTLGKTIIVRGVRDVSARAIVLRQRLETRVIETIATQPATTSATTAERDLAAELWSLEAGPPADGSNVVCVEDPRTGAVRRCPDCAGRGAQPCRQCGGLAALNCLSCGGRGKSGMGRNAQSCARCGGDGRVPCTHCLGGAHPCNSCEQRGSTFTVQRARIAWSDREVRSILDRQPASVEIDGVAAERELDVEFDGDVPRPIAGGSMDHFRASAQHAQMTGAIAAVAAAHRAGPNERVLAQSARVERVRLWEIECEPGVRVYIVGPKQEIIGADALRTGPGPLVAAIALVLGVAAILAGSVLR
jgi:hypothetical protein